VVVLLALKDVEGGLRFRVHPEFRTIVLEDDLPYLESLLSDFLERAKKDPEALFKQISSLGVGPLVTYEAGTPLSEFPEIESLSSQFLPLERF
jgi:hypothetical protein